MPWMPPELLRQASDIRYLKCDIWSLACTLFELLANKNPHPGLDNGTHHSVIIARILEQKSPMGENPNIPLKIPPEIDADIRNLIRKCVRPDPSDRPDTAYVLSELKGLHDRACKLTAVRLRLTARILSLHQGLQDYRNIRPSRGEAA